MGTLNYNQFLATCTLYFSKIHVHRNNANTETLGLTVVVKTRLNVLDRSF